MFIVNYFRYGFDFPNILARRREPFIKVLIFFILMVMISNVPHIYKIVDEEGWTISFIEESFKQKSPTYGDFDLPDDISIHYYGLQVPNNEEHILYTDDYMIVINAQSSSYDTTLEQVLLYQDEIKYINTDDETLTGSYRGFSETFDFDSVMLDVDNWQSNMYRFAESIEAGFSKYVIFYAIFTYTSVQILSTAILFIALSLILRLFKFGYTHYMSYFEGLKMLVFTLPIPVVIGFIVGFFIDPLTPFIMQFGIGLITMFVMLKFAKLHFTA